MSLVPFTIDDPQILQFFASHPYIIPTTFIKSKLNFDVAVPCENTVCSTAITDTDIRQINQDILSVKEAHEKLVEIHKTSLKLLSSITLDRIDQIYNGNNEVLHEKFPCEYCGKQYDTKKSTAMHRRACKSKPIDQHDADDASSTNEKHQDEHMGILIDQQDNQEEDEEIEIEQEDEEVQIEQEDN